MIGLGKTWRFSVRNATGVDIAAGSIFVSGRFVRFDTNGKQEFGADTVIDSVGAVANGASAAGTEQDNSTNKWLGGDFNLALVAPAGVNGRLDIYYERKVNGQWPSLGNGKLIAQLTVVASGVAYQDFSI